MDEWTISIVDLSSIRLFVYSSIRLFVDSSIRPFVSLHLALTPSNQLAYISGKIFPEPNVGSVDAGKGVRDTC